jgi:hypothetical protein
MSTKAYIVYTVALAVLVAWGCKKPYAPVAIVSNNSYLVVEGLINSGTDSTYIKMTRTTPLSSANTPTPELNATVTIEGDNNTTYPLQETGNGMYVSATLGLTTTAKYRLRIQTSNNEQYLSDFVEAKDTPDIDSLGYTVLNGGIQYYVSTHDPKNNTRYYRWDFTETYGYLALEPSSYLVGDDGYPALRINQSDKIYECYKTQQSNQILLSNSVKLSQDVIYQYPIDSISESSGKISHGYSLLVHQYALTADGYAYWQNLKKNTEQLGSIFDAQPSEIRGNIHSLTNPSEPVIGFISVSSIKTKRVFLDAQGTGLFVPDYIPPPTAADCAGGIIQVEPQVSFLYRLKTLTAGGDTVLITGITNPATGQIIAYKYVQKDCADCRAKAPYGTNAVPVFWPPTEHY